MDNCTEPNRAACPRLCSDFCNAKEEAEARRSAADCYPSRTPRTDALEVSILDTRANAIMAFQTVVEHAKNMESLYETECKDMVAMMKILKLVIKERDDAAKLLAKIMRDEVNHQDEVEKWLREYAPQHLFPENEKSPDEGEKGKAADRSHPTACSSFCHPAEKCCITEDGKCDALREVVGVDSLRLVSGSFTPGPWVWAWEQRILNSAHGKILDCAPCEGMWFARYNDQEDAANARLIAAAPDLLEALQNLENDDGSIPDHAWKLCQRAISKAIPSANAQGESQTSAE